MWGLKISPCRVSKGFKLVTLICHVDKLFSCFESNCCVSRPNFVNVKALIIHNLKNIEADLLTVNIPSLFLGNVFNAIINWRHKRDERSACWDKGNHCCNHRGFCGRLLTGRELRFGCHHHRGFKCRDERPTGGGRWDSRWRGDFFGWRRFSGCCCCCRWDPFSRHRWSDCCGGPLLVWAWNFIAPFVAIVARRGLSRSWRVNYHLWDG